ANDLSVARDIFINAKLKDRDLLHRLFNPLVDTLVARKEYDSALDAIRYLQVNCPLDSQLDSLYDRTRAKLATEANLVQRGDMLVAMGRILKDRGQKKQALQLMQSALQNYKKMAAVDSIYSTDAIIAETLESLGDYAGALPHRQAAAALKERKSGADDYMTIKFRVDLANNLMQQQKRAEEELVLKQVLSCPPRSQPEESEAMKIEMANLHVQCTGMMARCVGEQGKYREADPYLAELVRYYEQHPGKDNSDLASSLNDYSFNLAAQGRFS